MNKTAPSEGFPKESEWSFLEIERKNFRRAKRLEQCGSAAQMIDALAQALDASIESNDVRFSIDSVKNNFAENRRLIFQFKVSVELYDWFFNGRTGYRAQFWRSPPIGDAYNARLISNLRDKVLEQLRRNLRVRRIIVCANEGSREERCSGVIEIDEQFAVLSLNPEMAKIWLCEWLALRDDDGRSCNLGFAVLSEAARNLPKLLIPRWGSAKNPNTGEVGEGTRAPFPLEEHAWLDIKGAFIDSSDAPKQFKLPKERAEAIFNRGWT